MRSVLRAGLALVLLTFSTGAFADSVNFSYGDGSHLFVQGTLTGTFGGGVFTATSATGTYNGSPILLVTPGVDGAFSYNNLVYFPSVSGYSLDLYGLVFNVSGLGDVNLCASTGCGGFDGYTNISNFGGYAYTNVSATFDSPTPEPSTLLMFSSGILGLTGVLRRKFSL